MDILQHSGFAFVEFCLLLTLVTWLLMDKQVDAKFLIFWTSLGLLALAALAHTPPGLIGYLYLPFFVSTWSEVCTLIAAVILREYRREYKLLGHNKKIRVALSVGTLTAIAAGFVCWSVKLGGLGLPLLLTSFLLLGYCAQANRKRSDQSYKRRPSS